MNLINGLHHAALRCAGEEEMKRTVLFYCNVLGMSQVRSWGQGRYSGCMIDTGNGLLELFADAEPGRRPGQVDHIALATDDVDACVRACRSEGLLILQEPRSLILPCESPFSIRIAFVIGMAGEIIEFFCDNNRSI